MDLAVLQTFLLVVDNQSFTRVAHDLGVSQSTISKRISTLEDKFDAQLFDRIGGNAVLTEQGRLLLPHIRSIVFEAAEMKESAQNINLGLEGRLSLGIGSFTYIYPHFISTLKDFVRRYARVDLQVYFINPLEALDALLSKKIDLSLNVILQPMPLMTVKTLWSDELKVALSYHHPLAQRESLRLADLAKYPAALPPAQFPIRDLIEEAMFNQDLQINVKFETDHVATIRRLVVAGLAWSVIPKMAFTDDMLALPFADKQFELKYVYAVLHNQVISGSTMRFIQLLKEKLAVN